MSSPAVFFAPWADISPTGMGGVAVLTTLFGCMGIMMMGISFLPPLPWVIVLLFIGMMFLGMGNGAVFQIVPQRFPGQIGVMTGFVGAAGGIGGFLLPTLFGSLKDLTGTYQSGFLIFGLIGLLASILLQYIYQHSWEKTWLIREGPPLGLSPSGRVAMEVVFGG